MNSISKLSLVLFGFAGGMSSAFAEPVEVALVDRLNGNQNNYCIDTVGAQDSATPEEGLQAYTCYSYRGNMGFDQIMESDAIAKGQFLMTGFNVCMEARSRDAGSSLYGRECDGNALQAFQLLDDRTIRLSSADQLCVSVGDETRFGHRGPTGHQYKDLSLEPCSEERSAFQKWYLRTSMDQTPE